MRYRDLSTADAKSWLAQIRNAGAIGVAAANPEAGGVAPSTESAEESLTQELAELAAEAERIAASVPPDWFDGGQGNRRPSPTVVPNGGGVASSESAEESITRELAELALDASIPDEWLTEAELGCGAGKLPPLPFTEAQQAEYDAGRAAAARASEHEALWESRRRYGWMYEPTPVLREGCLGQGYVRPNGVTTAPAATYSDLVDAVYGKGRPSPFAPVLREGGCTTEAEQLRAENARLKALTESLTGMVRSSADHISHLEAALATLRASLEPTAPSPAPAPNPLVRAIQARPHGYGLASPEGM